MHDHQQFAESVAQHLPYLNRLVRTLTRGDPMTEDIVQQTMLKALVHADQFNFNSTVKTWLASIAMNEVRQLYRCAWRKRSVPLMTEILDAHRPAADSLSVGYLSREREVLLHEAVSSLPEPYRRVVELCDLQCLPAKEAAARLCLTLQATKTRRRRARKRRSLLVAGLKY